MSESQKPIPSEQTTATDDAPTDTLLLSQSNQLLANAQSLCNIPGFQPVSMAFPDVISGQSNNAVNPFEQNVQQLFAQQAQLFNPQTSSPELPQPSQEEASDAASQTTQQDIPETEELQAIRTMFDAN